MIHCTKELVVILLDVFTGDSSYLVLSSSDRTPLDVRKIIFKVLKY